MLRDHPLVERAQQVETRDFRPCQGMELETPGSSAQQVGTSAPELPGAGAAQHEAQALVLHQSMNLVQDGRRLLNLVDDDWVRARCAVECGHAFRERPWRPRELQQEPGIKQVEPGGFREQPAKQCRLTRLARSPQEGGLSLWKVNAEGASVMHRFGAYSEVVELLRSILRVEAASKIPARGVVAQFEIFGNLSDELSGVFFGTIHCSVICNALSSATCAKSVSQRIAARTLPSIKSIKKTNGAKTVNSAQKSGDRTTMRPIWTWIASK